MTVFRRYVAIGDSSTEGLVDPDDQGGYRGWADRLAEIIAEAQVEPLEYANLAVRGLRLREIRETQFEAALALAPDLLTVFGGVNDILGLSPDFDAVRTDLRAMFGAARERGSTVLTFTMPDPSRFNPFGARLRPKVIRLDEIIRTEAQAHGVLVVDFWQYPIAEDPRLWCADRLHGNALGHEKVAAALAWRLGICGADASWADPLPEDFVTPRYREKLTADVDWAFRHFAPWLTKNLRGVPHGRGLGPKRPVPTVVSRRG